MLVETYLGDYPWNQLAEQARASERLGFDSIVASEIARDSFITLTLAATSTTRARLATSVTIAFPRSPMIVAYASRNLHDLSDGRFALGLGTQVKGHIERRFSSAFSPPGPRLREYIGALRAIWRSWDTGERLNFQGKYYSFTLMTPEFSPPPSELPPIPVHIAAVNEYNIQLAGEVCDGLRVHPFATPAYARDVILPNVRKGAARVGRDLAGFELSAGGFIATGETDEEIEEAREQARYRIAFYGSTRTYLPVLEHHDWGALNEDLRALIAQERWSELGSVVPDSVLDTFCVAANYEDLPERFAAQWQGLADSVTLPMPKTPLEPGSEREARFLHLIQRMREIPRTHDHGAAT